MDHFLHLPRINIESPADDEVFYAVDDIKIPVLVEIPHIAGVQPPPSKYIDVFLGSVGIAGHHLRSAHTYLAALVEAEQAVGILHRNDLDQCPGQRQANRPCFAAV